VDKLRVADTLVDALGSALSRTDHGLETVPGLVLRLINEDLWQERIIHRTGEHVHFARFEEFVTTAPLAGLGASLDTLRRVCGGRVDVLDALDRVMTGRQGERTDFFDNIQEVQEAPTGTSSAAALRRLRKDRPDLHAAVLAGEKTPHGAMVEAGFRRRTVSLPVDDVARLAERLRALLSDDDRERLTELLAE
jgi:hypothetical protein